MKRNGMLMALFTCFILSVFSQNVSDFNYEVENGGITITGYKGSVKNVVIPETINGLPVIAIGNSAFFENQLTSITLPSTLTAIGNEAFNGNQLSSISLPDSLTTIGAHAFYRNQLTSIRLPDNLNIQITSIVYSAIYDKYIRNGKKMPRFLFHYLHSILLG